jgi:anti-sigma-K factor RskA
MSQNEIHNIDELLNSFIDGELDQRHQTEVQRLIQHDERIAERLLELQKCKRLVSSLPYTEAPEEMLGNIKASLKERKLLVQPARGEQRRREREGARHLLVRRLTAAAAMIGLVAVLAAVIYSIVAPQVVTNKPVAVEKSEPAATVATAEKPIRQATLAEAKFTGRLELKTSSPSEVAAFINKAIEYNIPSDQRTAAVPDKLGESHTLICSRQNLRVLLDELSTVWDKINSAVLLVNTGRPEGQIVIDAVAPEQIIEIAEQKDFQTQIKTAKFFAAMNNIAERSPGKEVQVAVDKSSPSLITIPKPVLTSSEKPITKPSAQTENSRVVHLTITVAER